MTEESLRTRVQLLTQVGALLLVIVYIAGFSTISLYHASFGISLQFNLFRPRILSAGTIFIVLTALGMVVAAQTFQLWTSEHTSENTRQAEALPGRPRIHKYAALPVRILFFLYFATFVSYVIARYLFIDGYELEERFGGWYLAMLLVGPIVGATAGVLQHMGKPILSVTLSLAGIIFMGFCLWRIHEATLTALLVWFSFGAFTTHSLRELIVNPSKLKEVNWHWSLVWAVSILTLFATAIYPHIKSSLGGGALVPATFQFVDNSILDNVSRAKVWVIDETDVGFYFVRSKNEKKAIFVPRGFIKTIYFGEQQ
jgi:hypothetical protein